MQSATFIGNLAKAPILIGNDDKAICKFTLISNEYAGQGEDGQARERQVSIQFTAFRSKAKAISEYARKGDQLIVQYRIANSHYQKDGEDIYGYDFIVDNFIFGAPGKEKREARGAK
jgi:single-strand DNA-binding protein